MCRSVVECATPDRKFPDPSLNVGIAFCSWQDTIYSADESSPHNRESVARDANHQIIRPKTKKA